MHGGALAALFAGERRGAQVLDELAQEERDAILELLRGGARCRSFGDLARVRAMISARFSVINSWSMAQVYPPHQANATRWPYEEPASLAVAGPSVPGSP